MLNFFAPSSYVACLYKQHLPLHEIFIESELIFFLRGNTLRAAFYHKNSHSQRAAQSNYVTQHLSLQNS